MAEKWQIVKEVQYDNFMDFYQEIFLNNVEMENKRCPEFRDVADYVYRGESNSEYSLKPRILRNSSENSKKKHDAFIKEAGSLMEFYERCNYHGLDIPKINDFENYSILKVNNIDEFVQHFDYTWIPPQISHFVCLAQHYGIPTRMLDWTFDIKVAAYFASKKKLEKKADNFPDRYTIWALDKKIIAGNNYVYNYLQQMHKTLRNGKTIDNWPLTFTIPLYCENPNINAQKGILTNWTIHTENLETFSHQIEQDISLDQLLKEYAKDHNISHRSCNIRKGEHVPSILYKFTFPYDTIGGTLLFLQKNDCLSGRVFPGYTGVVNEIDEYDIIKSIGLHEDNYFSLKEVEII